MTLDQRLTAAVRQVAGAVIAPEVDLDAVRSQAHTRRRRRRRVVAVSVAAVVVATIVVGTSFVTGREARAPEPVTPVDPPGIIGVGAVWYDAAGLHRGDVVEETPVGLFADSEGGGVLALVRRGALYRDPATDDVWFHPWNGQPRVVGRGSAAGPGGDPQGDVAAWFEGNELVVFDTVRGEEISRTTEEAPVLDTQMSEHVKGGHGFAYVSAEEVVWRSVSMSGPNEGLGMFRLDVETGKSSVLWSVTPESYPMDVHDTTRISGFYGRVSGGTGAVLIDVEGRDQLRLNEVDQGVEPFGRLSPSGAFVLAPTTSKKPYDVDGAAIADVRSGDLWHLPLSESYAWIAWSYGDLALVQIEREGTEETSLIACDAVTHDCDTSIHRGHVLLPAS